MGVLENLQGVVVRNLLDKEQLSETEEIEMHSWMGKWSFLTVHMVEKDTNQLSETPIHTSRIDRSATNPTWSDIDIRQPLEGGEAQHHHGGGTEDGQTHVQAAHQRSLEREGFALGEFGLRVWSCHGEIHATDGEKRFCYAYCKYDSRWGDT
jgi:hypothetical protein